ncbi:MAG: YraN family protein [Alphaproteobacteria bacterium]|nr:YraN family protein [Alphaproteobacteria bacterium]
MKKLLKLKITPYNSGILAEFLCRMYMRILGYRIIAKNYRSRTKGRRTPYGELDFVAIKKQRIVFCEVKKRKNDTDFCKALPLKQQKRIVNGGLNFLRQNKKFSSYKMEFDVFFVILPFKIKRIKNAIYYDNVI